MTQLTHINKLTREQILAMEPGRELDSLVAEKVMHIVAEQDEKFKMDGYRVGKRWYSYIPFYSTDISVVAWEVVEKMKSNNWNFVLSDDLYQDRWVATFYWDPNQTPIEAESNSAPEAICKAALLAVMEE